MMIVTTQTSILREGHPVSFSHSACGPSSADARAAVNESAEDTDISSLLGMLASVTDPRSPQGKQHALEFVLAVCVVAMLAGAKNYAEIARHAADMPQPLLKKLGAEWSWFRIRYKHPSKSTIRNVLTGINAAELDLITGAWLFAQARKDGKDEWEIALDGKVMRGAWTDENDKVTLFSAMLHREAVTIAQVRVPDILPLLRETPHHVMEEHSRGRIKRWSCWITSAEGTDFPHARQAAFIRREIFEISGDRISKEHALILTSRKAGKMTAADVNRHTRGQRSAGRPTRPPAAPTGSLAASAPMTRLVRCPLPACGPDGSWHPRTWQPLMRPVRPCEGYRCFCVAGPWLSSAYVRVISAYTQG